MPPSLVRDKSIVSHPEAPPEASNHTANTRDDVIVGVDVRHGRELGHAVALLDDDVEALGQLLLDLGAERRGAGHDHLDG